MSRQFRPATPTLPPNFLKDLRAVKGKTTVHPPKALRDRLASCLSDCLEGSMEKEQEWSTL
eukprot:16284332-Heterocapsa_arctica.AAC.1